jgi:transcriptional regulator with XRE-family HTH domain
MSGERNRRVEDMYKEFIGRLIQERQDLGLSQTELAREVGIAQSSLSRVEQGSPVMLETFFKIASTLERLSLERNNVRMRVSISVKLDS